VSLEDAFGLKLPDEALGRRAMRTVGKLVDLVLSYEDAMAAGGAAAADAAGEKAEVASEERG
jgi:hypothetical protein